VVQVDTRVAHPTKRGRTYTFSAIVSSGAVEALRELWRDPEVRAPPLLPALAA